MERKREQGECEICKRPHPLAKASNNDSKKPDDNCYISKRNFITASRVRLFGKVLYRGSRFHGFQKQLLSKKYLLPSVQTALEESFLKLFSEIDKNESLLSMDSLFSRSVVEVIITGASRTDAKVNAKGQVFQADLLFLKDTIKTAIECLSFFKLSSFEEAVKRLNTYLENSEHQIRVINLEGLNNPETELFACNRASKGKHYSYTLYDSLTPTSSESILKLEGEYGFKTSLESLSSSSDLCFYNIYGDHLRKYKQHLVKELNIDDMNKVCEYVVGLNCDVDFRNYTRSIKRCRKTELRSTKRRIYFFSVKRIDFDRGFIRVDVKGNGFLYLMVRCLVFMLVQVGKGEISVDQAIASFHVDEKTFDPAKVFPPLPGNGLCLEEVYF